MTMTASERPALRVSGVTKRYGSFVAVSNLSFEVPAGLIYGVLGPNGAGKTTTLRMINDILVPDGGAIDILGGLSPGREAARRIGYLPEERGLYPKMKVLELLRFFGELRGLDRREAGRRSGEWLERLGIGAWGQSKVQELSKGMQQKVQFASALIHEPELLILDEPWSGLDPINADVLREVVLEQREAGRTILFSTHLMEQAEQICDRVCIIARGERALEGELAQLKRDASGDRLVAVGFGSAEDRARADGGVLGERAVVESVRDRGGHLEVRLAPESGADELLGRLVTARVAIRRFEIVEPTLHQIFVDRVGAEAAAERREAEPAAGGQDVG